MSSPIARFTPSRRYLSLALFAIGGTVLSLWIALRWGPAWLMGGGWNQTPWSPASWIPATSSPASWSPASWSPAWFAVVFFALPAVILLAAAFRPAIEIHETHLRIGRRDIPWSRIARLDQTGWNVPLAVYLTLKGEALKGEALKDEGRLLVIYPGDCDSSASLLRYLRRYSREALLDGIPYRQFWGEPAANERKQLPLPRYPLLRPEDEEEVERMFQRLKTVGHLERRNPDEK